MNTIIKRIETDFWKSVKGRDSEEKIDLFFYRPLGYLIAKIATFLRLTPSHITLIGMSLGVLSGYYYYLSAKEETYLFATILFLLSGIFDSADGQLARLTKQSTKLGLILDGLCDNLVFSSIYLFAAYSLCDQYPPYLIFIITILAGVSHSYQAAILDFIHREYIYFGHGKIETETYWNPTVSEVKKERDRASTFKEKFMISLRIPWIKQQQLLSPLSAEHRQRIKDFLKSTDSHARDKVHKLYAFYHLKSLPYWRLLGTNMHTLLIIVAFYFKRFDLYLILGDLLFFNLCIILTRAYEKRVNSSFLRDFYALTK